MHVNLADAWEAVADAIPDAPALVHGSTVRTWRDFDIRAAQLATALAAAGVTRGSTVAINLYNCSEYLEVFFAALKLRAAPANVNYRYTGAELRQLLLASQASVLIYHSDLSERVQSGVSDLPRLARLIEISIDGSPVAVPGAVNYETLIDQSAPMERQERSADDFFLGYTGGTTGLPKGVMFRAGMMTQVTMMMRGQILGLDIDPEAEPEQVAVELARAGRLPAAIPASPLMHSTGLMYASFPTLLAGGSVVTLTNRSFDAEELFEAVERTRASTVAIVGDALARPMLHALDARAATGVPFDVSSIKSICSAGVAWSADIKAGLLRHMPGAVMSDACGSTEGANYGRRLARYGDVAFTDNFVANPGVKIVDDERRELPPGEIGHIASPTPATGYFGDVEASERVYYVEDGVQYVIPGDLGRNEGDGTITLLGRGSSVVNTGGEKVFPEEVEHVIRRMDGVDDCLVVGIPHERFGAQVAAIIQPEPGLTLDADELLAEARRHLAGYKLPRRVVFGKVPRLPNGKPDYESARQSTTSGRD